MHYFKQRTFDDNGARWEILSGEKPYRPQSGETVVWSRSRYENEELGEYLWPADMRREYERLTGKPEFNPEWTGERPINVVADLLSQEDEVEFNQPCRWAQHVKGHAVYCTNEGWLYSPRKCRRGGAYDERSQESCPGYAPNPLMTKYD